MKKFYRFLTTKLSSSFKKSDAAADDDSSKFPPETHFTSQFKLGKVVGSGDYGR